MGTSPYHNPLTHEQRKVVWRGLREGYSALKIARYLGVEELEFLYWLECEAPPNWRRAYVYGKRERFRRALDGLPAHEKILRMAEWDEKHGYVTRKKTRAS